MAIRNDLSSLPRAQSETPEGLAPDESPRFVGVLAEKWRTEHDEDKPTAMGTAFRHSDAGKCARALGYTAAGIPRSDPMDLTGVWNVHLGSMIHDEWQEALSARFPDAEIELRARIDDFDGSCHIDAVVRTPNMDDPSVRPDRVIAIELKTIGGFGFKAAVGKASRGKPAEGPKSEHLLQAALNGYAIDADEVVVAYLAKECISVNQGKGMTELGRFAAEWTFTRDQYEPLAEREVERVSGILGLVEKGELPARKIPDLPRTAEIVDPTSGRWEQYNAEGGIVDTGSWWACGYCAYQTLCAQTDKGRIPVESVVSITKKSAA